MDRWPAAAFKADCVLEEELDRLWHLVSILKAMTWSHSSGRRVGLVLWDVMMEKGDRKLAWHFWDGVTREESSTQKGREKKKLFYVGRNLKDSRIQNAAQVIFFTFFCRWQSLLQYKDYVWQKSSCVAGHCIIWCVSGDEHQYQTQDMSCSTDAVKIQEVKKINKKYFSDYWCYILLLRSCCASAYDVHPCFVLWSMFHNTFSGLCRLMQHLMWLRVLQYGVLSLP